MTNNRKKVITLSIVFGLVIVLGIGFAAFSSRLLVKTKVNVNSYHSFNVVFSSSSTSLQTNSIAPISYGTATGESATIDNSVTPTIENLSAVFQQPGDKIEYNFYAYNAGEFNAFLSELKFNNAEGYNQFKVCTTEDDLTDTEISNVCNSIKVTVDISNGYSTFYYLTSSNNGYTGGNYGTYDSIKPGEFSNMKVTIEYLSTGPSINNPFTISFGSISLYYTAIQPSTSEFIG